MAHLLKIDVSPRGDQSISRKLGNQFAADWQKSNAGGQITTRDLAKIQIPYVDLQWIAGAYSAPEQHTDEHKAALKVSDDFIADITAADHILIATPMYNFAIPAVLKAWIDHIVRVGKTFVVTPEGAYKGLITNKKATVIVTSSGSYAPGSPAEGYDMETPYLRAVLGFLGITDVTFIRAGGTAGVSMGKTTPEAFTEQFTGELASAAR